MGQVIGFGGGNFMNKNVYEGTVLEEWIDYNNHMNVCYYYSAFHQSAEGYLKTLFSDSSLSIVVGAASIKYISEVLLGNDFYISNFIVGYKNSKIHLYQEFMVGEKKACEYEQLCILKLSELKKNEIDDSEIDRAEDIAVQNRSKFQGIKNFELTNLHSKKT